MHPIERLRHVARASGVDQEVLVSETASALSALGMDGSGLVMACRRLVARHPVAGPLWWLTSRMLTAADPIDEGWEAVREIERDRTAEELSHQIPDRARVCVLGWPELAARALVLRGDVEVRVVDVHGEGSGLLRRLDHSDVPAVDVPLAGLGAAVADSTLVLLEASAAGPESFVGIAGSRAAAAVAHHAGVDVWTVAGVGRWLPARVFEALVARMEEWSPHPDQMSVYLDPADDGFDVDFGSSSGRRRVPQEPWDAEDEVVPLDLVDQVAGPKGLQSVARAVANIDCPIAPELLTSGR